MHTMKNNICFIFILFLSKQMLIAAELQLHLDTAFFMYECIRPSKANSSYVIGLKTIFSIVNMTDTNISIAEPRCTGQRFRDSVTSTFDNLVGGNVIVFLFRDTLRIKESKIYADEQDAYIPIFKTINKFETYSLLSAL